MNKILAMCCIGSFSWTPGLQAGEHVGVTQKTQKEVSLFEVPWQCPAAPAIGCGSHAKPILLQLERDSSVSEAWLNRQGTMVAVVWIPQAKKKARREVEKALKDQNASKLSGSKQTEALAEFNSGKGWYRGAEVDRLSEEEAGVIAARWVRRLQAKTTVPKDKADGLQAALTDALKKALTGKIAVPEGAEQRAVELRRVAGPYLDEGQLKILGDAAGCGMRAMPNEE
jgi:hypothetical protein